MLKEGTYLKQSFMKLLNFRYLYFSGCVMYSHIRPICPYSPLFSFLPFLIYLPSPPSVPLPSLPLLLLFLSPPSLSPSLPPPTLPHFQIWSLLPGFCTAPVDLLQSFRPLARLLGTALNERPDLRSIVCHALQLLIEGNRDNGE